MVIRLDGAEVTLLLSNCPAGLPEMAYWGPRLPADADVSTVREGLARPIALASLDQDYREAVLLPVSGLGLFRAPAFAGHRSGEDWTADFTIDHIITGLGRIVLTAKDTIASLMLEIEMRLHPDGNMLASRSTIVNQRNERFFLERLAAGVFLLPSEVNEVMAFGGTWGREFASERFELPAGRWATDNRRGRTSHDRPPFLFVGTRSFGEDHGIVHGVHLGWSGNHSISFEVLEDGRRLVIAEPLLHSGEVILDGNGRFATPWAYATLSDRGLGEASRRFHHAARSLVAWPGNVMRTRPVTLNTWEGNYFQHDVAALKAQATAGAHLGIERFVLDDGWFGRRDDDSSSLGDWKVDPRKYPDGLDPLIDHVRSLGMEFGIWVEPEMVSPDSDLFRAHPEWALQVAGRPLATGRQQLVLDLTRREVAEYLLGVLDCLLSEHAISYLKWDMNRDLLSAGNGKGRPVYHAQVEAFYSLLDQVRTSHPSVEIESCASGGGRVDFGVLARTHRFWTSDCTDALERVSIQSGFLRLVPPEFMGAHVSADPNHQTGRRHTLGFRAAVALLGHFGVELNPLSLSEEDKEELAAWIRLHKMLRRLVHNGAVVQQPARDGRSLSGVVSKDASSAVYVVVQEQMRRHRLSPPIIFPGLDPTRKYRVAAPAPQRAADLRCTPFQQRMWAEGVLLSGSLLTNIGYSLPLLLPESALVLTAEAIQPRT
jgi:alpha-galactosidase